MTRRNISVLTLTIAALFLTGMAFAQVDDPGVRSSTGVNAGQPLASISANPARSGIFQRWARSVQRAADGYGRQCWSRTTV